MNYNQIFSLPAHPVPYAVLGSPVNHSLSPILQQVAFDDARIDARYYRIEVPEDKLAGAVAHLREVPFGGWNCTVPNKVRMLGLCDRRAESADQFGAVNTVVNENGVLVGHNTDGLGWSRALREAFGKGPGDLRILVLGAGGAGRAIATQALLEKTPDLVIANRSASRARELADELRQRFSSGPLARTENNLRVTAWEDLPKVLGEIDLIVNATSTGLDPQAPSVLPARMLSDRLLVFDTVYGAGCAKFRHEVETAGAQWADGLGMLLHQGVAAFALWTGREAPFEKVRTSLLAAFSASRS